MFGISLRKMFVRLKTRHIAVKCGHSTKLRDTVEAFGERTTTRMGLADDGSVDWCHACLSAMAIRCAWCSHAIFIGDPVTLFSPRRKDFVPPPHAVVYSHEPLRLVGCLRETCADSGADAQGVWVPDNDGNGHVQRVPSLYELAMEPGAIGATGQTFRPGQHRVLK